MMAGTAESSLTRAVTSGRYSPSMRAEAGKRETRPRPREDGAPVTAYSFKLCETARYKSCDGIHLHS